MWMMRYGVMPRRLLVGVMLVAGAVAVTTLGSQSAGRAAARGSATRPVTAVFRLANLRALSGMPRGSLSGVSATSRRNAWAIGAQGSSPLIEHWNGRGWKPMPSGIRDSYGVVSLAGVAATSAANAWAVGTISTQYLFSWTSQWDGRKWTAVDPQEPGGFEGATFLNGVAGDWRKDAWAVGEWVAVDPAAGTQTLIEHWDGSSWVQVSSPNPAGTASTAVSQLQAVTAVSPTDAWAVGEANTGQSPGPWTTVIEHWDGTMWTTVPSPDPSRAGCVNDQLLGVAGAWAVGSYCGSPLVLHLQGGSWLQVPVLRPPGKSEQLASVAVTSKTNAWAVGHVGRRVLILHWNGAKWAEVPAPNPAGASAAALAGVSAVSRSIVWAVGRAHYPHNVTKLLIERWNGTKWKLLSALNPAP